MTEREMEWLLWNHPAKFFDEPLKKFRQQHSSKLGKSDLIFEDTRGALMIVEIKLGKLSHSAVGQIILYQEAIRKEFPGRELRLVLIANIVRDDRAAAYANNGIKCRAITEKYFRDVAVEVGFSLLSESYPISRSQSQTTKPRLRPVSGVKRRSGSHSNNRGLARAPAMPCPEIPETVWPGLARAYREAVADTTEASDNYHLVGFLVTAAAGLAKSLYVKMSGEPIYPNLYLSLVWRSGISEEAIKLARRLSRDASPEVEWIGPASWLKDLNAWQSSWQIEHPERPIPTVVAHSLYLPDLIEVSHRRYGGALKLTDMLKDYFYRSREEPAPSGDEPAVVKDSPLVCLLGNSKLDWLRGLREEQVEDGLGGRVMFVPGESKPRKVPEPRNEALWNEVARSLEHIFEFWRGRGRTEIVFTQSAKKVWETSYNKVGERAEKETLVGALAVRHWAQMLKIAMVFAAIDKSLEIDVRHVETARGFTDFLFDSLRYIFGEPLGARRARSG